MAEYPVMSTSKKDETPEHKVYFRNIGWGPFPMPGEKKRRLAAVKEADRILEIARIIDANGAAKRAKETQQ